MEGRAAVTSTLQFLLNQKEIHKNNWSKNLCCIRATTVHSNEPFNEEMTMTNIYTYVKLLRLS